MLNAEIRGLVLGLSESANLPTQGIPPLIAPSIVPSLPGGSL